MAAIAFFLWRGPEQNVTEHSLLEGVPSDAFLILDVPDAKALEGRLNGSSLIWEELQLFPAFSGMDSLLASLAKGLGSRGFEGSVRCTVPTVVEGRGRVSVRGCTSVLPAPEVDPN